MCDDSICCGRMAVVSCQYVSLSANRCARSSARVVSLICVTPTGADDATTRLARGRGGGGCGSTGRGSTSSTGGDGAGSSVQLACEYARTVLRICSPTSNSSPHFSQCPVYRAGNAGLGEKGRSKALLVCSLCPRCLVFPPPLLNCLSLFGMLRDYLTQSSVAQNPLVRAL